MTANIKFVDEFGPAKIIQLHEGRTGLNAVLVVDNVAAGPSIGGVRMAPDVSVEECFRLARAMTLKNAAAGLRHGGGKAVIFADPRGMTEREKETLIRAFAGAIRDVTDYIAGPDMGTDESSMAFIMDEIGRSVGLPREIGGIPLDEIGATGFGLAAAAEVAKDYAGISLEGARVAVQGFGSVGKHVARFLEGKGAVLVAAADSSGTLYDPDGIDVGELIRVKDEQGRVVDFPKGQKLGLDEIVGVDCDIWIPAARPDVIHEGNVGSFKGKLMLQGANIPVTEGAERILHERGVLVVPDFIANAGGVICAAVEYAGGTQASALQIIEEKLLANTGEVLAAARRDGVTPRQAATDMAERRVREAMRCRRWI